MQLEFIHLMALLSFILTVVGIYVKLSNDMERIKEQIISDRRFYEQKHTHQDESISDLKKAVENNTIAMTKLEMAIEYLTKPSHNERNV